MTDKWCRSLLAVFLLFTSVDAQATSFDCRVAKTPREQLICDNPELSSADDQLNSAYKAAFEKLPVSGKARLRQGQREWLNYTDTKCAMPRYKMTEKGAVSLGDAAPKDIQDCLLSEFKDRATALSSTVTKMGELVIQKVDSFKAIESKDRESPAPSFAMTEISYPQIVSPLNPKEVAWNRYIKKQLDMQAKDDAYTDHEDFEASYEIAIVSGNVISTSFDFSYYFHGSAHGQPWSRTYLWILDKQREMQPSDLFDPAKNWQKALAQLGFEALMDMNKKENTQYYARDPAALENMVIDIKRWTLGQDGLGIQFNIDEVGGYAEGAPKIIIPWSKLKPLLASTMAVSQ